MLSIEIYRGFLRDLAQELSTELRSMASDATEVGRMHMP